MVSSTYWNRRRASGAHQAEQDKCCRALLPAARHCPVQHSITQQQHTMPRRSVRHRGAWPNHLPPQVVQSAGWAAASAHSRGPTPLCTPFAFLPCLSFGPGGLAAGRAASTRNPGHGSLTKHRLSPGSCGASAWLQICSFQLALPSTVLLFQGMASPCACAALGWDAVRDRRPRQSSVPAQRPG